MVIKRFDIYLVNLDPTIGIEIQKTRPCVIVSPNEVNRQINTVIVVPLTSTKRNYPTRVNCSVNGKDGQIAVDQIRSIDKSRLVGRIAILEEKAALNLLKCLRAMFEV